jgi:hypothetical protein
MLDLSEFLKVVKQKYESLSDCLNERSRRLWCATEARAYGKGGVLAVHQATGISRNTIYKGLQELDTGQRLEKGRIRKEGGGRKKLTDTQPGILEALEKLVDPLSRGDPDSPLRWSLKSSYQLRDGLVSQGYKISQPRVGKLLSELDYSLQSNKKAQEGANHPDRNAQFKYINEQVKAFHKNNQPVISVDTKKKENIGEFKNHGQQYRPKGSLIEVKAHDFLDKRLGKVAPYGVYDIGKNKGWVSVGIDHDAAEFAVNAIRAWWYGMGQPGYEKAKQLLITADCGGSNGYRVRLWKVELQKLADETGLILQVNHFPPGTSKWNKIEQRMFSYISENWRGQPLISRETVVNLIGNTKTKKGLEIKAILDLNSYRKGIKISKKQLEEVNIARASFHGEWNYTIKPRVVTSSEPEVINSC